ncbi:endolytic transglycosylase MltG [Psychrobacillus vulpis]|uniref:Endolytic transglycosylase MltG n=1 Tax=Psychrobacillus vulpis TaxID=2325572 RepID=A0A544TQ10_9BACI|nr:endolytic transglycosylase MltG [Psychrobacillus vulpis]TQR19544.1 endolytic transglycosylase MltG [Psychrobacillus vulpis]
MNKASIRSLGIGLFLAGAVFQLQHLFKTDEITSTNTTIEEAYEKSQSELKTVKQQLAQLQLDLENAQKVQASAEKVEQQPSKDDKTTNDVTNFVLIVQSGMTSKDISYALESAEIILNKQDFEDYLITQNLAGRIQIGEYELDSSMTIKQIAQIITGN